MALSNATVFEVRTTGSDNNGGGFVTGASGTDYSQQNSAQYALTGLTTAAANAIILTSSAAAVMVGNLINITGGTNFITGVYQITAVSAGVSITVDRNCTSAAGAIGTANIGGCFASISNMLAQMTVTGMIAYVKATATYSIGTALSTAALSSPTTGICRIVGYTTTRTDGGRATIQTSGGVNGLNDANGGYRVENFVFDGNSVGLIGLNTSGTGMAAFNCLFKNWVGNQAINLGASDGVLIQCEVTANTSANGTGAVYVDGNMSSMINNYIHGNSSSPGLYVNTYYSVFEENIIASNGVGNTNYHGIYINFQNCVMRHNTIYANGGDGVHNTANYTPTTEISNNIIVSNGGYGLNIGVMSPSTFDVLNHHNAFYNNTSGSYNGVVAGTGDVTLTGVPFIAAGSGNFALNDVAGQGAACRAVGFPGVLPAGGTGYKDIGALQSQPNVLIQQDMTGGCRG